MPFLHHQSLPQKRSRILSAKLVLAAIGAFVIFTALRAISESWSNENFPEALAVKLELLSWLFPLHMVSGGLALLLVPLAYVLRGTVWHRWAGRVAAADVVVAGLTAFPVALAAPVTFGSSAGFAMQALVWLALLATGIWHIRHGHVAQHRAAMLMMAAVTSGALFFRVDLALWKMLGWHSGFNQFYAMNAWIAWIMPLLGMLLFLRRNQWQQVNGSPN